MGLLTLPKWVAEGQELISRYSARKLMYTPGIWTIRGIRIGQGLTNSSVRIECETEEQFSSVWVSLVELFEHWQPRKKE